MQQRKGDNHKEGYQQHKRSILNSTYVQCRFMLLIEGTLAILLDIKLV